LTAFIDVFKRGSGKTVSHTAIVRNEAVNKTQFQKKAERVPSVKKTKTAFTKVAVDLA
jgi:hypothetical protein